MAQGEPERRLGARVLSGPSDLGAFAEELQRTASPFTERINAEPGGVERGLARLVLTVIDLLRRLMEQQAVRRIEARSVTDDEVERMGQTFLQLERRMEQLRQVFDLTDADLNINLGPLGDLLPQRDAGPAEVPISGEPVRAQGEAGGHHVELNRFTGVDAPLDSSGEKRLEIEVARYEKEARALQEQIAELQAQLMRTLTRLNRYRRWRSKTGGWRDGS